MHQFRASLPLPPSVNHLYPTGKDGRRYKSKEYRDWIKEAQEKAFLQRFSRYPPAGSERYELVMEVLFSSARKKQDASNRIKPIEDFVADWMNYDDSQNAKITVFKSVDPDFPRVDIIVKPYG